MSYLPRALRLFWDAAPGWTVAWVGLLIIQGLFPVAIVYLTRGLVDSLVAAVGGGVSRASITPTLVFAGAMGAVLLLTELLKGATSWIRAAQAEYIQDHISAKIHQKSLEVDFAFYESPEYFDRLDRARNDAATHSQSLLESSGTFVQNIITLLALAAVLIPYGAWLPPVLLVSTLPALFVVIRYKSRIHQWWEQTTGDRRRIQYYDMLLTHSAVAAEMRLFGLGPHFQSAFLSLRQLLRRARLKLLRDQSLAQIAASVVGLVISGLVMAWMVWRAFQGLVTLGDLALFYQVFNRGQSLMSALLGSVGQIYSNSLFLGNLFEFLGLKAHVVDPPDPVPAPTAIREGIRFQNITFRYPESSRVALKDLNLTMNAGQVVAIVGANGAGKSTLVKLLARLYDPESGRITIDGVDIKQLSLADLRGLITVLFQMPVFYHATVAQNISLGDLSVVPDPARVEATARGAGAHEMISRLPQGYETLLGRWFAGGTDLSSGEWQRVALARSFFRKVPIVVLDEPTSFIDSWAEREWVERFRSLVVGSTAIIVTHRFTTAMCADVIHVMDQGQIIESGSHDELVARGGVYARSWLAQTQVSGADAEFSVSAPEVSPDLFKDHRGSEKEEKIGS